MPTFFPEQGCRGGLPHSLQLSEHRRTRDGPEYPPHETSPSRRRRSVQSMAMFQAVQPVGGFGLWNMAPTRTNRDHDRCKSVWDWPNPAPATNLICHGKFGKKRPLAGGFFAFRPCRTQGRWYPASRARASPGGRAICEEGMPFRPASASGRREEIRAAELPDLSAISMSGPAAPRVRRQERTPVANLGAEGEGGDCRGGQPPRRRSRPCHHKAADAVGDEALGDAGRAAAR